MLMAGATFILARPHLRRPLQDYILTGDISKMMAGILRVQRVTHKIVEVLTNGNIPQTILTSNIIHQVVIHENDVSHKVIEETMTITMRMADKAGQILDGVIHNVKTSILVDTFGIFMKLKGTSVKHFTDTTSISDTARSDIAKIDTARNDIVTRSNTLTIANALPLARAPTKKSLSIAMKLKKIKTIMSVFIFMLYDF